MSMITRCTARETVSQMLTNEMNGFEELSIFKNSLELKAFARGYIAAMPIENKYQQENDEWHAYSEYIDINFYTIDREIKAIAYKVVDGETDTSLFEVIYSEPLYLTHLIK